MARTTGRSGFKMKSSPAKGKLGDFFSSLGKQLKTGQKDRGIFSEKGKAEKKEMRKTGESKYQFDVRKKREARKADKPRTDALTREITDTSDLTTEQRASLGEKVYPQQKPKSKGEYITYSGKKGDKFKYRYKAVPGGDLSLQERHEFQYPEDHEKYKGPDHWETSKTKAGATHISNLWNQRYEGKNMEFTPIQKKSKGFKMPGYGKRK